MNYVKRSKHVKPTYDAAVEGVALKKKRPAPISMRFNEVQLARLKPYAGNQSLGVYCRDYILKGHNFGAGGVKSGLFGDQIATAQILREMGLAGVSENLHYIRQILDTLHENEVGSLSQNITQASADISKMHSVLLKHLNVHDRRNKCS